MRRLPVWPYLDAMFGQQPCAVELLIAFISSCYFHILAHPPASLHLDQ